MDKNKQHFNNLFKFMDITLKNILIIELKHNVNLGVLTLKLTNYEFFKKIFMLGRG